MSGKSKIETLGYPSQNEAIRSLYAQGMEGPEISKLTGLKSNVVYRALANYRKKLGIVHKRRPQVNFEGLSIHQTNPAWDMSEDDRRAAFHKRAVAAARQARLIGSFKTS